MAKAQGSIFEVILVGQHRHNGMPVDFTVPSDAGRGGLETIRALSAALC